MCQDCISKSLENAVVVAMNEWDVAHWKAFDKRALKYESRMATVLRAYFGKQQAYILNSIKQAAKFFNGEYIVVKETWAKFADALSEEEYYAMWDKILEDAMKPTLITTVNSEASNAYSLSTGMSFELNNVAAERLVGSHLLHVHDINKTTRNELYAELQTGFREGEGIRKLSARIMDVFDGADKYRAEMIARTEVIGASNAGAMEGYKEAGIKYKRWIASPKGDYRPDHLEMMGQAPIPLDEPFIVGGEEMMQPGDESLGASAGNIINCRCAISGVADLRD